MKAKSIYILLLSLVLALPLSASGEWEQVLDLANDSLTPLGLDQCQFRLRRDYPDVKGNTIRVYHPTDRVEFYNGGELLSFPAQIDAGFRKIISSADYDTLTEAMFNQDIEVLKLWYFLRLGPSSGLNYGFQGVNKARRDVIAGRFFRVPQSDSSYNRFYLEALCPPTEPVEVTVTASSSYGDDSTFGPSNMLDEDLQIYWIGGNESDQEWDVEVDLGQTTRVDTIRFRWYSTSYDAHRYQIKVLDEDRNLVRDLGLQNNTPGENPIAINSTGRYISITMSDLRQSYFPYPVIRFLELRGEWNE